MIGEIIVQMLCYSVYRHIIVRGLHPMKRKKHDTLNYINEKGNNFTEHNAIQVDNVRALLLRVIVYVREHIACLNIYLASDVPKCVRFGIHQSDLPQFDDCVRDLLVCSFMLI